MTLRKWDRDREFLPWVVAVSLATLAFFLILSLFVDNPFERFFIEQGILDAAVLTDREGLIPVPRLVTRSEEVAACASSSWQA